MGWPGGSSSSHGVGTVLTIFSPAQNTIDYPPRLQYEFPHCFFNFCWQPPRCPGILDLLVSPKATSPVLGSYYRAHHF